MKEPQIGDQVRFWHKPMIGNSVEAMAFVTGVRGGMVCDLFVVRPMTHYHRHTVPYGQDKGVMAWWLWPEDLKG